MFLGRVPIPLQSPLSALASLSNSGAHLWSTIPAGISSMMWRLRRREFSYASQRESGMYMVAQCTNTPIISFIARPIRTLKHG